MKQATRAKFGENRQRAEWEAQIEQVRSFLQKQDEVEELRREIQRLDTTIKFLNKQIDKELQKGGVR